MSFGLALLIRMGLGKIKGWLEKRKKSVEFWHEGKKIMWGRCLLQKGNEIV